MFRRPILAVLLAAATGAASTVAAEPPAAQTRDWRYVYYPVQQLYYSTEQQIWFWRDGNGWSYDVNLPKRLREGIGTGVPLMLATKHPYRQHAWVEQRYGQPWRAEHAAEHAEEKEVDLDAPDAAAHSDAR